MPKEGDATLGFTQGPTGGKRNEEGRKQKGVQWELKEPLG